MGNDTQTVFVIETGDYEQRHVVAVASSIASAVEHIKASYASPYRVVWDDVEGDGEYCSLVGHFDAVQGYSTKHAAVFEITAEALVA